MKFNLVDEYSLDARLREEIRRLLSVSFPQASYTRTRTYLKQFPPRRLLASEAGQLVGHLGLEHRAIGTASGPQEILGMVDVCVSAPWRGRGVASQMLAWVESLARANRIPFLVLFAEKHRVYERNGFHHASNPLRWTKIHEHQTIGIAEEALAELMVKAVGAAPWPDGTIDLLGHQF